MISYLIFDINPFFNTVTFSYPAGPESQVSFFSCVSIYRMTIKLTLNLAIPGVNSISLSRLVHFKKYIFNFQPPSSNFKQDYTICTNVPVSSLQQGQKRGEPFLIWLSLLGVRPALCMNCCCRVFICCWSTLWLIMNFTSLFIWDLNL